ncbi:MAG TPA: HupE/UreJ family protein [Polyangiaceae bacterium]|jgi:hydrogenase/urease accessory protein HupE|nr:HupE/UreJ family protein [Polyangiaceae bacterium]
MVRLEPRCQWLAIVAMIAVAAGLVAAAQGVASAHAVGLSRGTYVVRGREISAVVTLARIDAATFASPSALADAVRVSSAGVPCPGTSARFVDAPPDGTSLLALYTCPAVGSRIGIDATFVEDLPFGHRHVVHGESGPAGAAGVDDVLTRDDHAFEVRAAGPDGGPSRDVVGDAAEQASSVGGFERAASFVRMGLEHILTGYDHLLFLLGLVLASRGVRALLAVVTAFTAGHSISLASSALGIWAPSPALVEPLIAASIAYVGIENLIAREVASRWRLTFVFGLVHGFGFAGALREVHFERESVQLVLASFNVGVELGQLAVLAAVVPVVLLLRRKTWFQGAGVVVLNGGVATMGLAWAVVRVLGGTS